MDGDLLRDLQVLVVEDDYLLADELCAGLRQGGARVVGPVGDLDAAMSLMDRHRRLDGAVLDINLQGEMVYPVAERLSAGGVPFVFSTGYDESHIPSAYMHVPRINKPVDLDKVLSTLSLRIKHPDQLGAMANCAKPFTNKFVEQFIAAAGGDPGLERVEFAARSTLFEPGQIIDAVYFPDTAVVSFMAGSNGARPIGVAVVGYEGVTDLITRRGDRAIFQARTTLGGSAWRLGSEKFLDLIHVPDVQRLMLAYKEALSVQFAYSALAHGTLTIEARLARWILMLDDRSQIQSINISHNDIAEELAVRRSGVTTALHVLEGLGAIKSTRGNMIVRDRATLNQLAGASYGVPEREYRRILGFRE